MHHSGDRDLGANVAALMHEVCERLPEPVARSAFGPILRRTDSKERGALKQNCRSVAVK
jgi:hypothetical protein